MAEPAREDVTQLLRRIGTGDESAMQDLMGIVYDELRRIADRSMGGERRGHTLQTTALVNETYLRLIGNESIEWSDRRHFFQLAGRTMRRILIDHARKRQAQRRGGMVKRVPFEGIEAMADEAPEQLLSIDEALTRFAEFDERRSQVVELRFFAGLDHIEIGRVLGISVPTVERDWAVARAWLHREISR